VAGVAPFAPGALAVPSIDIVPTFGRVVVRGNGGAVVGATSGRLPFHPGEVEIARDSA